MDSFGTEYIKNKMKWMQGLNIPTKEKKFMLTINEITYGLYLIKLPL